MAGKGTSTGSGSTTNTSTSTKNSGNGNGRRFQVVPSSGPSPKVEKYDRKDFLIPAHDEHGHSIPYSFRADKRYADIVSKLIWARALPYRTPADFMRHAIDRHVKWCDTLEPGTISNDIMQLDAINHQIRELEKIEQFSESILRLEATVQKLIAKPQLRGSAIKMVYDVRKTVERIQDANLRRHFLSEIKQRFGHLFVQHGEKISLGAIDSEHDPEEDMMFNGWGYDPATADEQEQVPEALEAEVEVGGQHDDDHEYDEHDDEPGAGASANDDA